MKKNLTLASFCCAACIALSAPAGVGGDAPREEILPAVAVEAVRSLDKSDPKTFVMALSR